MSTHAAPRTGTSTAPERTEDHRGFAETKGALKTSEFFIWLAAVIAIIITAAIVGASRGSGADPFSAFQALQLITIVSIGYLVSRGLAKAGSRADRSN